MTTTLRLLTGALAAHAAAAPASSALSYPATGSYAVVVSEATHALPEWRAVVGALRAKHDGACVVYSARVEEARDALAELLPRYACFVARPEEARRQFVVDIHRLTRQLDDDPYGDVIWGILTGYDAADALRVARHKEPLIVRKGLGGTGSLDLSAFEEGAKFNEGVKGSRWVKPKGSEERKEDWPADSTKGLVDAFNDFKPDLFMTSGHATTRDWQIGYNYKDGQFRCENGQLFGLDTKGKRHDINSPNPKVFLPAGNCLIGHIPTRDCMALALMHTGGVYQMFGYTAVTFHGYMGWGTSDYFIGRRDRYTLAQAFYANNQSLVHKLETQFPRVARLNFERYDNAAPNWLAQRHKLTSKDELGLPWDRDCVAFYGDPAWEARFPPTEPAWAVELDGTGSVRQAGASRRPATHTLRLATNRDGKWPGRPVVVFLPRRLVNIEVTKCEGIDSPLVTDNFVLLPLSGEYKEGDEVTVRFRADEAASSPTSARSAPIHTSQLTTADREQLGTELASLVGRCPVPYRKGLARALAAAGENRPALHRALKYALPDEREAMAFLVANMPEVDTKSVKSGFLLRNVRLALRAREQVPWGSDLPDDVFLNDVLPYASLNERRDDWRDDFVSRFLPVVKDCTSPGEAAVKLNKHVFDALNVHYHATKRPKPDQSPYESREATYASCTGLSILLVDACRACAIPARVVGLPAWTGKRGNHTWVEVWDNGWHFLGASESDQLDHAWFTADAAKANTHEPMNRIYASSWKRTAVHFPLVWDLDIDWVSALDVTDRYVKSGP